MRFIKFLPFLLLGGFMILHGFAHLPGILGSLNLVTFDDASRQPDVLLTNADDGLLFVLGAFWLLAATSFVVAGIGVLRRMQWWPMAAAVALAVSIPITLLWQDAAVIGLVINIGLLILFVGGYLVSSVRERRFA